MKSMKKIAVGLVNMKADMERKLMEVSGGNMSRVVRTKEFIDGILFESCNKCQRNIATNQWRMSATWMKDNLCPKCRPLYDKHFAIYVIAREADKNGSN